MFSKRQGEEKQGEFWIESARVSKPTSQGFYSKLNEHLVAMDFARQVWALCVPAYCEKSRGGRPGIDLGDAGIVRGSTSQPSPSPTPTLFIAAEHQGLLWRIEIKAHHVPKLFLKLKVLGGLEIAHPVGLQLMGRPESLHARFAQAGFAGHRAHAPGPPCGACVRARLRARPTALGESRGLRSRPGASWSPSKPLAAHRFRQRPMAKRLTDCSSAISWWESPRANPKMIRARKTSRCA
jgi:hypothetical protein